MQNGTPTERFAQESTVPRTLQGIEENVLNDSPEARTSEILCKPMGEHNGRLTSSLNAVYQRDEKRFWFLDADECTDAYLPL